MYKNRTTLGLILLSLPFNYGLTFQFGFNLKIYELVFCIFLLISIMKFLAEGNTTISLDNRYSDINRSILILLITVFFTNLFSFYSFYINIFDAGIRYDWAVGRFSPFVNSFVAYLYLLFSLLIFVFFLQNLNNSNIVWVLKTWIAGAVLCVLYLIYSNLALHSALPELILPGMDEGFQYGRIFGFQVIRSGTFKEGNFLSGYLLASAIFSYYLYLSVKKKKYIFLSFVFTLSIFLTLSTVGVLLVLSIFSIYFTLFSIFLKRLSKRTIVGIIAVIITLGVIANIGRVQEYAREVVLEKLVYTDVEDAPSAYSKFDRIDTLMKAVQIFFDYPVAGVGTYNFGYYYPLYWSEEIFSDGTDFKKIPNNVYVQILCENGLITIVSLFYFFFIFLKKFLKNNNKSPEDILMISLFLVILIKWNAYPTYTLAYDWISFAIIAFLLTNDRNRIPTNNIAAT